MIDWVIYITLGILVGFAAGYYFSRLDDSMKKKCNELEHQLDHARQEMNDYKQDVTRHFVETSSLINNMTDSYRAVYDHMATGAKTLCSNKMIEQANQQNKLDIPTARLIETETSVEPPIAADSPLEETLQESTARFTDNKQPEEPAVAEEDMTLKAATETPLQDKDTSVNADSESTLHEPATAGTDPENVSPEHDAKEKESPEFVATANAFHESPVSESHIIHKKSGTGPDKDAGIVH